MDRIVLRNIPFEVDQQGLAELMRIKPGSHHAGEFSRMLEDARLLAGPKGAFAVTTAQMAGNGIAEIGGEFFTSRLLCANLEKAGVVFPYAATCGIELEEWSRTMKGMLHSYWADSIMLMALGCAVSFLEKHLEEKLGGHIPLSSMNPGSLEDWPLTEQAPLFSLLGESASSIGVRLTDRMVLRPLKSVSGIYFVSREHFTNCSLCPRQGCTSRRAVYIPDLYEKLIPEG